MIGGSNRERKDALKGSFERIPDGWVCDECGALAPRLGDAEKHLRWHTERGSA